jgi:hypothetical protein
MDLLTIILHKENIFMANLLKDLVVSLAIRFILFNLEYVWNTF